MSNSVYEVSPVERITSAQKFVAQAESGQDTWEDLLYYIAETVGPIVAFDKMESSVGTVSLAYHFFRIIEAVTHHYQYNPEVKGRVLKPLVAWAQAQIGAIENLHSHVDEMDEAELAEVGRFYMKRDCDWAINLANIRFPEWVK